MITPRNIQTIQFELDKISIATVISNSYKIYKGIAFYIFLRYCPPTLNKASVICPKEHTFVASINLSNKFSF